MVLFISLLQVCGFCDFFLLAIPVYVNQNQTMQWI